MGAIGGLIGGALGAVGGFFVGGPVGAIAGGALGYEVGDGIADDISEEVDSSSPSHNPPDYSEVMKVQSTNNMDVSLAQIAAQQFAIQQASMDRNMQAAVSLELGLERLDTKLQTAKLDYFAMMRSEENRHTEKMTELKSSHSGDFPKPSLED